MKLAINGAKPAIDPTFPHFEHPNLPTTIIEKMKNDAEFRKSVYSFDGQGLIHNMEQSFENVMGFKQSIATNSGTSALFSMFYAMGLREGDEVIVPAYTFFATAMPLFVLGCTPILVDCLDNGNVDPTDIHRRITPATKAIVITHMWGIPCDMREIMQISEEFEIPVLEDVSHAHGALYMEKMAGSFGVSAAWSLGAKKILSGGQGGIFRSDDDEIFQRAYLLMRANEKILSRVTLAKLQKYSITGAGLNLRIHPFSAALIEEQISQFPLQLQHRREVAQYIREKLSDIPGIDFPRIPNGAEPSWYALTILYDTDKFDGISKETFVNAVVAEGATGVDIPGSHRPLTGFDCFRDGKIDFRPEPNPLKQYEFGEFKNAERFHKRAINLPVWYGPLRMQYAQSYVEAIIKVIENIDEMKNKFVH